MEALRAAFIANGAISASDCMKLAPFSRDDPATQVAAFKAKHPDLFYGPPATDYRKMPWADVQKAVKQIENTELRRRIDSADAWNVERLKSRYSRRVGD